MMRCPDCEYRGDLAQAPDLLGGSVWRDQKWVFTGESSPFVVADDGARERVRKCETCGGKGEVPWRESADTFKFEVAHARRL